MIFALDYDNTFSRNPRFWETFIEEAFGYGYSVYIVTSRGEDTPIEHHDYLKDEHKVHTIYCNYRAKKLVTEQLGIKIDIWIDDNPKYIVEGFIND